MSLPNINILTTGVYEHDVFRKEVFAGPQLRSSIFLRERWMEV